MDLRIIRRIEGFDFVGGASGLSEVQSFETMIPVALFGGNIEQNTPQRRIDGNQYFDYWANATVLQNEPQQQFNSQTERILNQVALNSSGRERIQRAAESDLEFMRNFADFTVNVSLVSVDRVKIAVKITEPNNLNQTEFVYIWDKLSGGIIGDKGSLPPEPQQQGFPYNFNFNF